MSFKDFLAKQPINVIIQTDIEDNKVKFPSEVDSKSFYTKFTSEIESDELTTEKAIYIASMEQQTTMINYKDLLNSKLHF